MCFEFFLQFLYEKILILKELIEMWQKMYVGLHVKHSLFLPDCNQIYNFLIDFWKIIKYQI